eukprot:4718825-Prymnesium_polylepis.2
MEDETRLSYLLIANRSRIEAVNAYTVLSLGVQAYLSHAQASAKALMERARSPCWGESEPSPAPCRSVPGSEVRRRPPIQVDL